MYNIGDRVLCHINYDGTIIFDIDFYDSRYSECKIKDFEIIGIHREQYLLLAEHDVEGGKTVDTWLLQEAGIKAKFLWQTVFYIGEVAIGGRLSYDPYMDALSCEICKEPVPYAEPNTEDDKFICWICKQTRLF